MGAAAIDGICRIDNSILWVGRNPDGGGTIWRAAGYTPKPVSTYAIEQLIQSFGDISDARAYPYQEGGHAFARFDFPSANSGLGATLVYDVRENEWHERTFWDTALGVERADLARCHCYAWGKHLVGDYRSGTIYEQSMDYATDAGNAIRRLRATPDIANDAKLLSHSELRLQVEAGVGLDGIAEETETVCQSDEYNLPDTAAGTYGPFTFSSFDNTGVNQMMLTLEPMVLGGAWTITASIRVTIAGGTSHLFHFSASGTGSTTVLTTEPVTILAPANASSLSWSAESFLMTGSYVKGSAVMQLSLMSKQPAPAGADPKIILQVSNDGGITWGNERARSLGKLGKYRTLVKWTRLGRPRNRAYRILCSEPVRFSIVAADLEVGQ
jgi:hypothetical protein